MTWQVLITVFTLGGLGAMVRGSITMILASSARIFPMAILIVNLLAAYLGGFLLQLELPEGLNAAIAIGLIGGIGTLSAVHGNLLDLIFDKAYRRLALYLGLTIFGGVLCCYAGMGTGNFVMSLLKGPQSLQNQMMMDTLKQQEEYLNSLQHEGHIDYENLPNLSPLPEGQDSLEDSLKALEKFREEASKAAAGAAGADGADGAAAESAAEPSSEPVTEPSSEPATEQSSEPTGDDTTPAAIGADTTNDPSAASAETPAEPVEPTEPDEKEAEPESGTVPDSEASEGDATSTSEQEMQTEAQLQQLQTSEIAATTQFNKVGA